MKIVKIILVFVVFAGLVALVLNWNSIFEPSDGGKGFSERDAININARGSEIRSDWADAQQWDKEIYEKQIKELQADSIQGYLSQSGYNTVSSAIRESSMNKVYELYKSALHPEGYSHAKLLNAMEGVAYLEKHERNAGNDNRLKELQGIHNLYTQVYNFNGNPQIRANFNSQSDSWVSFDSQRNGILQRASNMKGNSYFKEISGLSDFSTRLDAERLQNVLSPQRAAFYSALANQIKGYFSSIDATDENMNRLNRVYTRFSDESSDAGIGVMVRVVKDFKERNKEYNEQAQQS